MEKEWKKKLMVGIVVTMMLGMDFVLTAPSVIAKNGRNPITKQSRRNRCWNGVV